ncbi:alkyl hydroperoxide reductase [Streptomyces sp. CB00455]|uniref:peroxiredoxin n=1 Tax=Streptomyces sp. CB00455 TaxID=1703927 RepID=UPI000938ED6B|nr:peroxiredoxin [Streptomyces sp. CB00455]OKK22248.1 alkyl hydroperoxide reductase [Streptomyces sp. CB00455]
MGRTPAVGDIIGDFSLPGGCLTEDRFERGDYSLREQRGKPVVLAFYPGDNTPVCTAQLCSYSDGLEDLRSCGATVWGISPQDVDSHERFARERGLRIPLLADAERSVARAFGIDAPLIGLRRSVFIVAPDGRLHWKRVGTLGATFPAAKVLAEQLATAGAR